MPIKVETPIVVVQPVFQPVPVVKEEPVCVKEEPQAPIKKYYGRRREDLSSDDEMNVDEEDQPMDTTQQR